MKKLMNFLSILMLFVFLSIGIGYAQPGGEGNNNNCQGEGNPNSPCNPGDITPPTPPPFNGGDTNIENTNKQLQGQLQLQGQVQGQKQSQNSNNENNNSNRNTNSNNNENNNSNRNTNLNNNENNNSNRNTNSNNNENNVSANNSLSNDVSSTSINNINNEITFEGDSREFPNQGNVTFGSLVTAYADDNLTEQFIKLEHLTMYSSILTVEDAKKMIKDVYFGKRLKIVPTVEKTNQLSNTLNLTAEKIDTNFYNVKVIGYGVAVATNDKTISAELLAKAVVDASEYGATHLQFLAEGTTKQLQASGWGIGFNSTKADSNNSIQTGGTGYSSAKSSYAKLPWQQFMILKVTKK